MEAILNIDEIAKIIANAEADDSIVKRCRRKMSFGKRMGLKEYFDHVQGIVYFTEYVMHFQNLEWIELRLKGTAHITCHDDSAKQEYYDARRIRDASEYMRKKTISTDISGQRGKNMCVRL